MIAAQAGLQGAQTGFNYLQQREAAKDQKAFVEKRSQAVSEAVNEDTIRRFSVLARRNVEDGRATSRRAADVVRQAARAKGGIVTQAGGSGVSGDAVNATLRDFQAQEIARIQIIQEDRETRLLDTEETKAGIEAEARQRIASSIGGPINTPSLFWALFQIGSSALGAAVNNSTIDPETGKRSFH